MDDNRNLRIGLPSLVWLLTLFVTPLGHAAKWVNIAEGAYGRALYLDSDSIQRDGLQVQAWTRETFTEEQRSPHTGVLYYSANTWTRFECGKRTVVPLSRVFYGGDGTELRRIKLDQVELPEMTTPGSLPERLLVEACRPPAMKPASTHVAAADSKPQKDKSEKDKADKDKSDNDKPKGDVPPPGAAGEPAKTATDKEAKTEPEAKKSEAPSPAKVAEAAKPEAKKPAAAALPKPVEPAKLAVDTKAAKPAAPMKAALAVKPALHETKPAVPPMIMPRYVERRQVVQRPYRIKAKQPAKRAVTDAVKPEKPEEREIQWSYEGTTGPQHWASLKPEFAACAAGKRQSPIDIQDGARLELEPIKFDYRPSPLRIVDNGHTVQINYAEGSSISISGVRYDLRGFHFHKPAEERVNGKLYDMVAHLVHQSAEGRLAVIAVLMESGGTQNDFLSGLWPYLPLESGREIAVPDVTIDVMTLLPESHAYYTYMGSLSTPPCSEGVLWLVMKTPVTISAGQVAVFGKLYKMNARPVQAGNGRLIKESM
jgi:carbonic anhydrase